MKKLKIAFLFLTGSAMIVTWLMLLFSDRVEELSTEPSRIITHIAAEFITAVLLILSAILALRGNKYQKPIIMLSLGALLYTLISSTGYYITNREFEIVFVFAFLLVVTLVMIGQELYTWAELAQD